MAKAFPSFAHSHDALIVRRPADVLDGSCNGLELVLKQMLLVDRVPNANLARGVWREKGKKQISNITRIETADKIKKNRLQIGKC